MPLFLTEDDVAALLTMPEAMAAIEAALVSWGMGRAGNHPRQRFFLPRGVLHHMAAYWLDAPGGAVMGTKTYASFADGTRFYLQLFSAETGDLLAYLEADRLGQIRTGAATGVAAKFLALPDVHVAGLLGTGYQAETQAEALAAARPTLRTIQVFGRDPLRREDFCRRMTAKLGIHCEPAESAEAAVRGASLIASATTSREPVLRGEWLSPGDFVAAAGANRMTAREIDEETIARAAVVAVDDLEQARAESAELVFAYERRRFVWERALPLAQIIAGHAPGRLSADDITLFLSLGIGLEDIAAAALVYEKARAQGAGRAL